MCEPGSKGRIWNTVVVEAKIGKVDWGDNEETFECQDGIFFF